MEDPRSNWEAQAGAADQPQGSQETQAEDVQTAQADGTQSSQAGDSQATHADGTQEAPQFRRGPNHIPQTFGGPAPFSRRGRQERTCSPPKERPGAPIRTRQLWSRALSPIALSPLPRGFGGVARPQGPEQTQQMGGVPQEQQQPQVPKMNTLQGSASKNKFRVGKPLEIHNLVSPAVVQQNLDSQRRHLHKLFNKPGLAKVVKEVVQRNHAARPVHMQTSPPLGAQSPPVQPILRRRTLEMPPMPLGDISATPGQMPPAGAEAQFLDKQRRVTAMPRAHMALQSAQPRQSTLPPGSGPHQRNAFFTAAPVAFLRQSERRRTLDDPSNPQRPLMPGSAYGYAYNPCRTAMSSAASGRPLDRPLTLADRYLVGRTRRRTLELGGLEGDSAPTQVTNLPIVTQMSVPKNSSGDVPSCVAPENALVVGEASGAASVATGHGPASVATGHSVSSIATHQSGLPYPQFVSFNASGSPMNTGLETPRERQLSTPCRPLTPGPLGQGRHEQPKALPLCTDGLAAMDDDSECVKKSMKKNDRSESGEEEGNAPEKATMLDAQQPQDVVEDMTAGGLGVNGHGDSAQAPQSHGEIKTEEEVGDLNTLRLLKREELGHTEYRAEAYALKDMPQQREFTPPLASSPNAAGRDASVECAHGVSVVNGSVSFKGNSPSSYDKSPCPSDVVPDTHASPYSRDAIPDTHASPYSRDAIPDTRAEAATMEEENANRMDTPHFGRSNSTRMEQPPYEGSRIDQQAQSPTGAGQTLDRHVALPLSQQEQEAGHAMTPYSDIYKAETAQEKQEKVDMAKKEEDGEGNEGMHGHMDRTSELKENEMNCDKGEDTKVEAIQQELGRRGKGDEDVDMRLGEKDTQEQSTAFEGTTGTSEEEELKQKQLEDEKVKKQEKEASMQLQREDEVAKLREQEARKTEEAKQLEEEEANHLEEEARKSEEAKRMTQELEQLSQVEAEIKKQKEEAKQKQLEEEEANRLEEEMKKIEEEKKQNEEASAQQQREDEEAKLREEKARKTEEAKQLEEEEAKHLEEEARKLEEVKRMTRELELSQVEAEMKKHKEEAKQKQLEEEEANRLEEETRKIEEEKKLDEEVRKTEEMKREEELKQNQLEEETRQIELIEETKRNEQEEAKRNEQEEEAKRNEQEEAKRNEHEAKINEQDEARKVDEEASETKKAPEGVDTTEVEETRRKLEENDASRLQEERTTMLGEDAKKGLPLKVEEKTQNAGEGSKVDGDQGATINEGAGRKEGLKGDEGAAIDGARKMREANRRLLEEARILRESMELEATTRSEEGAKKKIDEAEEKPQEEKRIEEEEVEKVKVEENGEEEAKKLEEAKKAEDEAKKLEEEKKEEEEAKKLEEEKKLQDEGKKLEEEKKAEEEAKRLEEEKKSEEEAKRLEEEKNAVEDAKRLEEEKNAEEEAKKLEEEKNSEEEVKKPNSLHKSPLFQKFNQAPQSSASSTGPVRPLKKVSAARAMFEKKIQEANTADTSSKKVDYVQNVSSARRMFEQKIVEANTAQTSKTKVDGLQNVSSSRTKIQEKVTQMLQPKCSSDRHHEIEAEIYAALEKKEEEKEEEEEREKSDSSEYETDTDNDEKEKTKESSNAHVVGKKTEDDNEKDENKKTEENRVLQDVATDNRSAHIVTAAKCSVQASRESPAAECSSQGAQQEEKTGEEKEKGTDDSVEIVVRDSSLTAGDQEKREEKPKVTRENDEESREESGKTTEEEEEEEEKAGDIGLKSEVSSPTYEGKHKGHLLGGSQTKTEEFEGA